MASLALLRTALGDLAATLSSLTEDEGFEPSGCRGWTVLDLAFHLVEDAHRALVDLNTPVDRPADTDAIGYWRPGRPSPHDGDDLWSARVSASVQGGLGRVARRHARAAAAVLVAAEQRSPGDVVHSEGAALTVADQLSHLTVEATIHHLDLVARLAHPGPAPAPLAEVRRVLGGLAAVPFPDGWDDATAARRATGREPLTDDDRASLGPAAERFPLFG